jgi:uncharacterized protein
MINWDEIEGFDWDLGNERKSVEKHGVSESEAEQVFFSEPLLVVEDKKHSADEPRFHALGMARGGRPLHVTFTLRGNGRLIRVISARAMSKKERLIYDGA